MSPDLFSYHGMQVLFLFIFSFTIIYRNNCSMASRCLYTIEDSRNHHFVTSLTLSLIILINNQIQTIIAHFSLRSSLYHILFVLMTYRSAQTSQVKLWGPMYQIELTSWLFLVREKMNAEQHIDHTLKLGYGTRLRTTSPDGAIYFREKSESLPTHFFYAEERANEKTPFNGVIRGQALDGHKKYPQKSGGKIFATFCLVLWWSLRGSNSRPPDCQFPIKYWAHWV